MKKIIAVAASTVLGLSEAACGSDNPAEEQAEAIEDSYEAEADRLEDADVLTDEQADALEEHGEDIADAVRDAADEADLDAR